MAEASRAFDVLAMGRWGHAVQNDIVLAEQVKAIREVLQNESYKQN